MRYEVTAERLTFTGRVRKTRSVEADTFRQTKGTATFVAAGRPVAVVKRVVRICWD